MFLLDFITVIILAIIIYQDFKIKAISWYLLPVLFIPVIIKGLQYLCFQLLLQYFLINIVFVLLLFIGVTIYYSIKNKKLTNIINTSIGLGDILFFIVLCSTFSTINFIIFILITLILISIIYGILIYLLKISDKRIPLAGNMAIFLIILILLNFIVKVFNFYDDNLVLSILSI